jgi:predicted site-specific integrase-resolvase
MTQSHNINAVHWNQSQGVARQTCARFFRDGLQPADAMRAFGLEAADVDRSDWSRAVEAIANVLSTAPQRRVA